MTVPYKCQFPSLTPQKGEAIVIRTSKSSQSL